MSEFLAEARVLVRPDVTGFAATLKAELTAIAKASAITVPVIAATAAGGVVATEVGKTTAAIEKQAAASRMAGASAAVATKASTGLAHANILSATASEKLALAQGSVANAASKAGAAQITATRSTAATVAAQKSLNAELILGNVARVKAAESVLRLAKAQEAEASTALAAARAQRIHAASLGAVRTGASSAGLSLLGVRGATLAANAPFLAGAAALIVFAKSLGVAARLEQELNVFSITAGATADEMERVSVAAEALGRDISLPAVSAGDAASAMTELAKAGLSVEDSITGARGVLQLATAAQIDNATATNIAASALNAFGLGGDQAVHVADLLANAANEAQGGISEMGESLASVASVSRQVGISLTDTVALLTLLAKNGIQGAAGGTVLRVALLRLVAPSVKAAGIIKQLGLQIRDAQGNIRPDVFAQFADATEELSNKQRDAFAAIVFGTRGIRGQAILGREGAAALREMAAAVEKEGTASAVAGARTAGFSGKVENAKNQIEALGLELGKLGLPAAGGGVDILAFSFGQLADSIRDMREAFSDTFGDDAKQVAEFVRFALGDVQVSAKGTTKELKELFQTFRTSNRGATAVNELALALAKMIEKLKGGDEAAQRVSKRLEGLLKTIQETGTIPPISIDILLNSPEAPKIEIPDVPAKITFDGTQVKKAAEESSNFLLDILESTLSPEAGKAIGFGLFDGIAEGAKQAIPKITAAAASAGDKISAAIAVAQAAGDQGGELAGLRSQEARQAAFLERLLARPQDKQTVQLVEKAAQNLDNTRAQIQSILDEQAADSEEAKRKISDAQDKASKAFVDGIENAIRSPERLLIRAGGTDPLKDDIKFRKQIIAILENKKDEVFKILGNTAAARQIVKDIEDRILVEAGKLKTDQENFRKQLHDALVERIERIRTGIELDVELADINENTKRRISLRQRLIQNLLKERKKLHLTGNALKENRNEIARINQEIEDIKGETKQTGNAFKELTFQFLQTQQGFAANLLGNLIPGGMTGGLVGGVSGPTQAAFTPAAGVEKESAVAAGRDRPFSAGQGSSQLQILRQIRDLLRLLNSRTGHPEAKHQKATSGGSMDVI